MWDGAQKIRNSKSTRAALDFLQERGFVKTSDLVDTTDPYSDNLGMLAVYDLIIAGEARDYSTCALRRKQHAPDATSGLPASCTNPQRLACKRCNYVGKFAELSVDYREHLGKASYYCWPQ